MNNIKSEDIKEAALKYFTIHGYEGASLALIADDAGIKKQSIYSHFKGKDDLFLQVLSDAKETELQAVEEYFNKYASGGAKQSLHGFLLFLINLFQENEHLRFWLRMTFFPPAHLAEMVEEDVIDMEKRIYALLYEKFQGWITAGEIEQQDANIPARAFLGVTDSLMIELTYGKEEQSLKNKLNAFWTVYWRGISVR